MAKLERIIWILLLFIAFLVGGIAQRRIDFIDSKDREVIDTEIHLRIPQTRDDLEKEILHVSAQKAMLLELEKWWGKEGRK
jgi:hypothetical protein